LSEPFEYVKKLSNSQLPFGIAETRPEVRDLLNNTTQEETRFFQPQRHTVLWSCIFARPGNAMQCFYQWQRKRKMWWRKVTETRHFCWHRITVEALGRRGGKAPTHS
jgi:hypothetical protein